MVRFPPKTAHFRHKMGCFWLTRGEEDEEDGYKMAQNTLKMVQNTLKMVQNTVKVVQNTLKMVQNTLKMVQNTPNPPLYLVLSLRYFLFGGGLRFRILASPTRILG